jgi:CheY-like chemotaxis protein
MLQILIVDDTKEDLLLAERVIKQCNLLNPVTCFRSGDGLISFIQKVERAESSRAPEPSLILLDLIMAPGSGLDVLRYLRSSFYAKHCLVVMVSGLTDIKAINEGYQLGAKTFLLKPLNALNLVELLNGMPDRLLIEAAENGYTIHSIPAAHSADTEQLKKTSRMIALAV